MEAVAKLKNHRGSARKMRLVVDLIRGMEADKALNILKYNKKHASQPLEKLLVSAIKNWEQKNEGSRAEDSQLYVKEAFVDGAKVLKRWQPAPFGRAYRIRKRFNHTTIVVASKAPVNTDIEPKAEIEQKTEKAPAAKKKAAPAKKTAKPAAKKSVKKETENKKETKDQKEKK